MKSEKNTNFASISAPYAISIWRISMFPHQCNGVLSWMSTIRTSAPFWSKTSVKSEFPLFTHQNINVLPFLSGSFTLWPPFCKISDTSATFSSITASRSVLSRSITRTKSSKPTSSIRQVELSLPVLEWFDRSVAMPGLENPLNQWMHANLCSIVLFWLYKSNWRCPCKRCHYIWPWRYGSRSWHNHGSWITIVWSYSKNQILIYWAFKRKEKYDYTHFRYVNTVPWTWRFDPGSRSCHS